MNRLRAENFKSYIKNPTPANLLTASGTRAALKTITTRPFENLQNVAESSIKEKVGTHLAYVFKRYHTGKGDDFESVAAITNNPNLPMDCSGVGTLAPGSPLLAAMMRFGGHFFTVNMDIPVGLKPLLINTGKGTTRVQLDYLIIDPRDQSNIKIYIIEFKAGSTQLVMGEAEEEQMVKATEIFKKWYPTVRFTFRLFYSPFLANQPSYYKKSHTSLNVDYLTISGLSKIIRVPVADLQRVGNLRANLQKNVTRKLYDLQDAVISQLVAEGVESNLRKNGVLSSKTPANFGIQFGNYGNFGPRKNLATPSAPPNFKASMSNITRLMTSREILKKRYLNNPTNANLNKLAQVTGNILNKHQTSPILTNNSASQLQEFLKSLNWAYTHVHAPRPIDVWETFVEERAELLGPSQYIIPELNASTNYVPKKDIHIVELERIANNTTRAFRDDVIRNLMTRLATLKTNVSRRVKNTAEKNSKLRAINGISQLISNQRVRARAAMIAERASRANRSKRLPENSSILELLPAGSNKKSKR